MTDLFLFNSYKPYLRNIARNERGILTRIAKAAGCELSYLSRSLSHEINITADQAFKISVYLKMPERERDYFLLLVEIERAGDKTYIDFLRSRCEQIIRENENLKNRVQRPLLKEDLGQFLYHSNWLYSAIHILLSIRTCQKVSEISRRLNIPAEQANHILEQLLSMGFIKKTSDHYEYVQGATHTPKDSPLVVMHHQNWRQRAVLDSQSPDSNGLHYTGVQSISFSDYKKIKSLLLKLLETNT